MPNLKYLLSTIFVCTLLSINAQNTPSTRPNLDLLFQENYFETQLTTTTEGEITERNPKDVLLSVRTDQWHDGNLFSTDSLYFVYLENGLLSEQNEHRPTANEWRFGAQTKYTYNDKNKLLEQLRRVWTGSDWANKYSSTYSYDLSNRYVISSLWQEWEDDNWLNISNKQFEINTCGDNTMLIHNEWVDSSWSKQYRIEYFYDTNHYVSSSINDSWDSSNSTWDRSYRYVYSYNEKGQLLKTSLESWEDTLAIWIPRSEFINEYNEFGNQSYYAWRYPRPNNTWENKQQRLYEYDQNQNLISYTIQEWNEDRWENEYRELNTYNLDNAIVAQKIDNWNNSLENWEQLYYIEVEYNNRKNISKSIRYYTSEAGSEKVTQKKYYYQVTPEEIIDNKIVVSPNPSDGCFHINFKNIDDQNREIRVFDLRGALLYQKSVYKDFLEANIHLHFLPNGAYFLNISNGELASNQRIIIAK